MEDVNKNTEANTEKTFDWRSIILKVVLGIVVFIVVICVIPYTINCLILKQARFEIVGNGTHWLSFWASYLAAIASFAMVLITWWTLRESKKQNQNTLTQNNQIIALNKQQYHATLQHWEDEVRPYIEVRIVKYFFPHQVCLEFYNFGKTTAKDITFSFKQTFLDKIKNEDARNALSEMGNHTFSLLGGSTRLIPIALEENVSNIKVYVIGNQSVSEQIFKDAMLAFMQVQTIEVCGKYGNKYTFDEVIPFFNCDGERRTIEASLGNITRALDNITKRLNPIDKTSLENIAQSISTLSSIVETKKASDTSLDNINKTLSNITERLNPINEASLENIAQSISTLSSIIETKKTSDISLDNIDKTLSSLLEDVRAIKASRKKKQSDISRKEKRTKTNN